MASALPNAAKPSSHNRWRAVAWLIVLASIFGLGWLKASENERDVQAQRVYDARLKVLLGKRDTQLQKLRDHARSLLGQPGSKQQLEMDWNAGEPFETQEQGESEIAKWTDLKYGCELELKFEGEVLRRCNANSGTTLQQLYPRPARFSRSNTAERVRRTVVSVVPWIWLVLLIGSLAAWPFRQRLILAEVHLAVALACGMAWLVSPMYSITWQGVFSNDSLFFAIVMILYSVVVLSALILSKAAAGTTRPFRYRLGHLLLALTIVAILLSAGPIGYLTLAVAAVGLAIFVLAYWVRGV